MLSPGEGGGGEARGLEGEGAVKAGMHNAK